VTGRRESNKRRTRERLEAAAFDLFLERGYDETSVSELARAADIAERTFFRHFPTKEDIVFCRLEDDLEVYVDCITASLTSPRPSWPDLARGLERFARRYETSATITARRSELVLRTPALQPRAARIQAIWRRRTAETVAGHYEVPDGDLDVQLLAATATAVLTTAIARWAKGTEALAEVIEGALSRTDTLIRRDGPRPAP
jgi:AcrR family transcriptional regulator